MIVAHATKVGACGRNRRRVPMSAESELVAEFLVESNENLDRLDQDFVALEKDPKALDRLGSIFRTIHTIKGTCGFLGFKKLESVTHAGESLLSRLRDGELAVSTEIITALLRMVDAVREMLASIQGTGEEGGGNYDELVAAVNALKDGKAAPGASGAPRAGASEPAPAPEMHEEPAGAPGFPSDGARDARAEAARGGDAAPAGTGIRVDVALLDKLMNLVGELVLARNQILQFSSTLENATLAGSTQRLNLITSELQEGVMKTRMQPIGNVWSKFPRIVRDVASTCGKRVRVEMEGRDTELDKTIIEAIKDPLTHIIRNSVDHGIESPEARADAGKPEEGLLHLRAFHEGGQVNIEIVDDGAGIDVERVKKKGVERGLITPEHAARMGDREATNLVFLPGFSTADRVTNVSGRGVGMDVVKTNIEKIGGTVDLQSTPGAGTTLRIRIPLTLAIIPALMITSDGERFAIPQVSLLELVRLEMDQRGAIEQIHGAPVYRLRGNLLPLVHLKKELKTGEPASGPGPVNIVVLRAEDRQFGLVVDEINDTEEIVVKPLGKLFKGLSTFAGATIMGDGRVALILDVMGLAQRASVVAEPADRNHLDAAGASSEGGELKQTLLLFQVSDRRRMAIPLTLVARLEEFPASAIEAAGDRAVVQYRGQIMPLVNLSDALRDPRIALVGSEDGPGDGAPRESVQVIVHTPGDRSVGLVVDRIVDIVEQVVQVQPAGARPGVLGSAVIDRRVTELLDVEGVVRAVLDRPVHLAMAA
jgi:two-component system chemotaxis sensor kinase CheA